MTDRAESYAKWIVENQDKKGTPEFDTVASAYKAIRSSQPQEQVRPPSTPLKIGAEGFPAAMQDVAKGFSTTDQFLGGVGSAGDLMAMRLKQFVSGLNPQDEANVRQQRDLAGATWATLAGNIAGNVAVTAAPAVGLQAGATQLAAKALPMMAAAPVGAAIAGGTVAAATNPVLKGESELANVGMGAAGNVMGTYAAKGLSHLAQPIQNVSKSTLEMVKRGFSVTPGQASGGSSIIGKIEQQLQSVAVLGHLVERARASGVKDMNVGAIRETVPAGTQAQIVKAGREAVEKAGDLIDTAYDKAYSGITKPVSADAQFWRNVTSIPQQQGIDLPPSLSTRFNQLMQDRVLSRLNNASADTLRDIQNSIGAMARKYRASSDPDQRSLGMAFQEAKTHFRDLVSRKASPDFRASLEALDGRYRDLLAIEKASGYSGSKEGVFSADALYRASKGATSKMKDFANSARDVYGATVPDSGTAGRISMQALPYLLGGGMAAGNEAMGGPGALTALGLGGALMASPMAGKYFYGGYPGQQFMSSVLRDSAPYLGQVGRASLSGK